jgi:hypothetical protein
MHLNENYLLWETFRYLRIISNNFPLTIGFEIKSSQPDFNANVYPNQLNTRFGLLLYVLMVLTTVKNTLIAGLLLFRFTRTRTCQKVCLERLSVKIWNLSLIRLLNFGIIINRRKARSFLAL